MKVNKNEKEVLREKFVELYSNGKNVSQISLETGYSRKFITGLLKGDCSSEDALHKKIKVYKRSDNHQMSVYIPTPFLTKIGISQNVKDVDFVDVLLSKDSNEIIIKKHI